MRKRVLVAQSGGPTVAINASLAGVIAGVVRSGEYERIIGAANGILGVLNERFTDLSIFENDVKAGNDSISDIVTSGNDDVQKAWCPKSQLDRLALRRCILVHAVLNFHFMKKIHSFMRRFLLYWTRMISVCFSILAEMIPWIP